MSKNINLNTLLNKSFLFFLSCTLGISFIILIDGIINKNPNDIHPWDFTMLLAILLSILFNR